MSQSAENLPQAKPSTEPRTSPWTVALIGNPNTGKSTLFNALTGLKQHVGNYPGVTVERKTGAFQLDDGTEVELVDLPGTYSLAARSPDEMIAVDVLLGQQKGERKIDAILAIADASNPERNFYLISQLCELGVPVLVALNMLDVAESKGITVDAKRLAAELGAPVVGVCANKGKGLPELRFALRHLLEINKPPIGAMPIFPVGMTTEVDALFADLRGKSGVLGREINRLEAFRALVDKGGHAEKRLTDALGNDFAGQLQERRQRASKNPLAAEEVKVRYAWVKQILSGALTRPAQPPSTRSDTIDKFVTHWASGTLIFALLMLLVFQSIFSWAEPLMEGVDGLFKMLSTWVGGAMSEGALKSLVCDGVIAGVGGVLIFLPQICLLFLFIAVMEDCGYMSRAAFLMDRLLSRVGLSGKSFIPMLSSFACAIPGVMATRTIENWRDRLTTILVAPLMSCSARLPVYTIMINSFIPNESVGGLGLQGLTLFGMYCVGLVVAIPVAWLLKKTLLKGETPPFLIELPSYKIPDWKTVLLRVFDRGKAFTVRAGTVILAVSVVVWALAYFPRDSAIAERYEEARVADKVATEKILDQKKELPNPALRVTLPLVLKKAAAYDAEAKAAKEEKKPEPGSDEEKAIDARLEESLAELAKSRPEVWSVAADIREIEKAFAARKDASEKEEAGEYLRQSYFGRMGHAVEGAFTPLGWDWRVSMAAIASFPAREVIVATLGTIFNLGAEAEDDPQTLTEALRGATWDGSERKLFNIPVALSIMVFFALCSQCGATLATIRRETNSWRWPLFSFGYMTALAYIGALIAYQAGMALGWGG